MTQPRFAIILEVAGMPLSGTEPQDSCRMITHDIVEGVTNAALDRVSRLPYAEMLTEEHFQISVAAAPVGETETMVTLNVLTNDGDLRSWEILQATCTYAAGLGAIYPGLSIHAKARLMTDWIVSETGKGPRPLVSAA